MGKLCTWIGLSSKRLLSFTLAVCLLISIVPIQSFQVSAAGDAVAGELVFDFRQFYAKAQDSDPTHATIANDGWELNRDADHFGTDVSSFKSIVMTADGIKGDTVDDYSAKGSAVLAVDVMIPESNYYKCQYTSAKDGEGAWTRFNLEGTGIAGGYSSSTNPVTGNMYITKGRHTIVFAITTSTKNYPASVKLTPVAVPASAITLTAESMPDVSVGKTESVALTSKIGSVPVSLAGAIFTAVPRDASVASAMVVTNEDKTQTSLSVTGIKAGSTTIDVSATLFGATKTVAVPVTIIAQSLKIYTFDFRQCVAQGHDTDVKHATIETHGWELNQTMTTPLFTSIKMGPLGILADAENDASDAVPLMLAFDVMVPETGYYSVEDTSATNSPGGWTRFNLDGVPIAGGYASPGSTMKGTIFFVNKGRHTLSVQLTTKKGDYPAYFTFREQEVPVDTITLQPTQCKTFNTGTQAVSPLLVYWTNNGTTISSSLVDISATVRDSNIASVEAVPNGKDQELRINGLTSGSTVIDLNLLLCGKVITTAELPITVKDSVFTGVALGIDSKVLGLREDGKQLLVKGLDKDGQDVGITGATITYESRQPEVVTVSDTGYVKPVSTGSATIVATVTLNGVVATGEITLIVKDKKVESTLYSPEMIAAARENVKKYSWATALKNDTLAKAEKYLGKEEQLWQMVTTQELPRSLTVGARLDPNAYTCRYCGCDLRAKYGLYSWKKDPMTDPWKIQCPDCKRRFPSNDFGSYYKTGLDEHGIWSYEAAKKNGQEYLKNILYPEKDEHVDAETGELKNAGVHNWGVDDGWGYKTGKMINAGSGRIIPEMHSYIAYYNHWGLWYYGTIIDAMMNLSEAYLYTGDAKYGRVGAILTDRYADIYPSMNTLPYFPLFFPNYTHGKAVDLTWECATTKYTVPAYDILYKMYDDPYVVDFLSKKASQYKMDNPKTSPALIRQNCEDGILREVIKSVKDGHIHGNFGMHQSSLLYAAISLDSMPETKDAIDWVFQSAPEVWNGPVAGGNVTAQLLDLVNRDGFGNEGAPYYDNGWVGNMKILADSLAGYPGFETADLYKNPKFLKMISSAFPLTLCRRTTPDIGDGGYTASTNIWITTEAVIKAFELTKDPKFAQYAYFLNGNKVDGIHADVTTKDPESIQKDILSVINTYGEYDFDKSIQLCGLGFSVLRGGSLYSSVGANASKDTQRDFWMYYGIGRGKGACHGHPDGLNLGIESYGLNMAPDFGYPETCDGGDKYRNWGTGGINHNVVQVDESMQNGISTNGNPMHFDDSGRVKLMDVDAHQVYSQTSIYRRTMVMIDASDDVSYGIDFFRVKGGNDQVYSFHSLSDEIYETEGLNLVKQVDADGNYVGTYAGSNVAYGTLGSTSGYAWLQNVRKDANMAGNEFSVDFKIKDFRRTLPTPMNLHMRMTMLNNFKLTSTSIVTAIPPQYNNNPKSLEMVLARRHGTNLDSLFTTVYEPYKDTRYIEKMEQLDVTRTDGVDIKTSGDIVKAVKVTLVGGRVDYVVYAANNSIEYRIGDLFNFRGFVGVYTTVNGEPVYSYMNDGDTIGNTQGVASYTGKVTGFTKELSKENTMTVSFNGDVNIDKLKGQYIYVNNDGSQNAAYPIYGAKLNDDGTVALDLGDITMIRKSRNVVGMDATYVYNIAEGQTFKIPLPTISDPSPVFDKIDKRTVDAKSELSFILTAKSPVGKDLTYKTIDLPRGASYDILTHVFKWVPDSAQVGKNRVSIEATDGSLTTTVHFEIQVLSATRGGGSNTGGGTTPGGTTPGGTTPGGTTPGGTTPGGTTPGGTTPGETTPGETTPVKIFVDLVGYDWAKEAITTLADQGIINGTGKDSNGNETFTPSANITRADYALLLVRTFKLESTSTENFVDTDPDAYYAKELAVAKANGIITGDGGNHGNPTAQISRQDMMVMVYRAILKQGYKLEAGTDADLQSFSDAGRIDDYAREAAAALSKNGIVSGSSGKLNPDGKTTRAEVAVILRRVVEKFSIK